MRTTRSRSRFRLVGVAFPFPITPFATGVEDEENTASSLPAARRPEMRSRRLVRAGVVGAAADVDACEEPLGGVLADRGPTRCSASSSACSVALSTSTPRARSVAMLASSAARRASSGELVPVGGAVLFVLFVLFAPDALVALVALGAAGLPFAPGAEDGPLAAAPGVLRGAALSSGFSAGTTVGSSADDSPAGSCFVPRVAPSDPGRCGVAPLVLRGGDDGRDDDGEDGGDGFVGTCAAGPFAAAPPVLSASWDEGAVAVLGAGTGCWATEVVGAAAVGSADFAGAASAGDAGAAVVSTAGAVGAVVGTVVVVAGAGVVAAAVVVAGAVGTAAAAGVEAAVAAAAAAASSAARRSWSSFSARATASALGTGGGARGAGDAVVAFFSSGAGEAEGEEADAADAEEAHRLRWDSSNSSANLRCCSSSSGVSLMSRSSKLGRGMELWDGPLESGCGAGTAATAAAFCSCCSCCSFCILATSSGGGGPSSLSESEESVGDGAAGGRFGVPALGLAALAAAAELSAATAGVCSALASKFTGEAAAAVAARDSGCGVGSTAGAPTAGAVVVVS
jgi:hypothetical protein